ncbi:MAG: hypothetical protein OXI60_11585 [Acidiferrobacterales bacterium]|nr:hypothetical protein [Acidiferrobacterales bacterium]
MDQESAKAILENDLTDIKSSIHDPENYYIRSYPYLLRSCKVLYEQTKSNTETEDDAILAIAHIAYSWMPTVLKSCELKEAQIAQHKKDQTILDAFRISCEEAKHFAAGFEHSPINDSWIGLSKALHFINPKVFPIWDSNVARSFETNISSSKKKQKKDYLCYFEFCHSHLDLPSVKKIQDYFAEHKKYEISRIRAVEYILFISGQKNKK